MSHSESDKWTKWSPIETIRSPRFLGTTCRCPICGQKNSDDNHVRNSYIRVGIFRDECGFGSQSKKESRRLRRTRERNVFQNDLLKGYE